MSRSDYQQRVSSLLEELEERRRHLRRLAAAGATRAGLRDLKRELDAAQRELAGVTGRGLSSRDVDGRAHWRSSEAALLLRGRG
jgi:hypothetical protein